MSILGLKVSKELQTAKSVASPLCEHLWTPWRPQEQMTVTPSEALVNALQAHSNRVEDSDPPYKHVESQLWKVAKLRGLVDAVSAELEKEQNYLLALKYRHKNSSAPVNRLPEEVLGQIFHLFRPSPTRDEPIYSTRRGTASKMAALRAKFCAVCYRWREVILSDPTMWNVLYLAMDEGDNTPVDYIRWARLQLERSGNAPLDLSISLLHPAESCQPMYYALLREHIPRCQRLALAINYHIGARYLLLDLSFPNLKTFKILYTDDSGRHLSLPPAARTRIPRLTPVPPCYTPVLNCLTINAYPFNTVIWDLSTGNYDKLKFLSLNSISESLTSLFDFLSSLPQLEHLSWNCTRFDELDLPPPITLPNLVSLSVQGDQPALQSLHTPNITRLEFHAFGSEWDDYISTLSQTSDSSSGEPTAFKFPLVRYLDISSGTMSTIRAVCDHIVPQLEHLEELSFYDAPPSAVDHIIADRRGRNLPPLRAISILTPGGSSITRRFIAPLLLDLKLTVCLYRQCNRFTNYSSDDLWLELKEDLSDTEGYDRVVFVNNKSKGPSTFTIGPWGEAPDVWLSD
ncbi:hypothetical protein DL93DRAFT_2171917 [Clavulina sp. PMI_390]|nr:hypothetical protein DL93DRAFT_2171917 [Clavulina sp. PMI_390]